MQPDSPAPGFSNPPTVSSPQPSGPISPDFSFLNQTPTKRLRLPGQPGSLRNRLIVGVAGLIFLIIIIIILKGLLTTSPFSTADYLIVLERQQEMYHIVTTDVTTSNIGQLSGGDQDFAATAQVTITTALSKTLSFTTAYGDKISTAKLADVYSTSIDSGFSSALSANDFDSYFHSTMQSQLSSYEQELSTAYNSTTSTAGRSLLKAEYAEARLLTKALVSPAS